MSNLSIEKIRYLAALGLAGDQRHIAYYVSAMEDPYGTVTDSFRREYAADVLNELLNIAAEDHVVYDHIVSYLMVHNSQRFRGRTWMEENAKQAIENKASKSGIPEHILYEVYDRGYDQTPPNHLTREQNAFNAVNSFIAHGKSWRDNPDLRLWGTDSLTQIYADATPGQSADNLNKQRTAFNTIKRVIKK